MKINEISIPATSVAELKDPYGKGQDVLFVNVALKDLPDIPLDGNPRAQNMRGRVAKQIETGLLERHDIFHLLNRGITLTTRDAIFDGTTLKLSLETGRNGAIDGGTSLAVIRGFLDAGVALDGFVRLEILKQVRPIMAELAKARNTSAQVKDQSLANLSGHFEWIKTALKDELFAAKIAYRENEEHLPIDIRDIVGLATLFHPDYQNPDNPPIVGYSSKAKCLQLFEQDPSKFERLAPILPTILKLYDFIHLQFPTIYESIGGFTGAKKTRLVKVNEVRRREKGFNLYFIGEKAQYRIVDAWLYPIVASLRGLINYETMEWSHNPFDYFAAHAPYLVKATLETAKNTGRNPNAVGKSRQHWTALHQSIIIQNGVKTNGIALNGAKTNQNVLK